MLCLNFEIYNGVNVKQCNYLYNDIGVLRGGGGKGALAPPPPKIG